MSQRTIAVPAGAFSWAEYHRFKKKQEGIEWIYDEGKLRFAVPRPLDCVAGNITVRLLFKCTGGAAGKHRFFASATTHRAVDASTTSHSGLTPYMDLPGESGTVYATSTSIEWEEGLGNCDWWSFKLDRQGMYRNNVVMMGAGVDYEAAELPSGKLPVIPGAKALARKVSTKAGKSPKKPK